MRPGRQLGAVGEAQLGQDAVDVYLHRPDRQEQPPGDLPVAEAPRRQRRDFLLAAGEGGRRSDAPGILGLFIEAKLDRLAERQLPAPVKQLLRGAAGTATFLGERYHRVARRRGKAKAQVAVARSILVIIWHRLASPEARFTDLGYGYYAARTDKDRKIRNHIRQIEALLGHPVTIAKAA